MAWGSRKLAKERVARIRLLNAELDAHRGIALERTRQIETKASFIVVAAGVLASATGATLVSTDTWLLGLVPFALTVATVVVATAALWPRPLKVPSARSIVNRWVNETAPTDDLDDYLLEVKVVEVELRDDQNELRMKWTKRAFRLLALSLVTAFLVAAANATIPLWRDGGQQTVETPAHTESTGAP